VEDISEEVRGILDSVGFALRHEVRRVFDAELGVAQEGGLKLAPEIMLRAHWLLENCCQQATVTLAQAFDPSLRAEDLFPDIRDRREQSIALCRELEDLNLRVRGALTSPSVRAAATLLSHVRRFRYERMHLLMYRDWESFERFADALEETYDSMEAMDDVLHRLSCFLEALWGQVRMRTVLAEG
jgi:hypothetical protein